MVLEAQRGHITESPRIDHACYDAAPFLLGRETPHHAVEAAREKPLLGVLVALYSVGLFHAHNGPCSASASEMARIEHGYGARPRHVAQMLFQPKINYRAGRHLNAEIDQRVTDGRR